MPERLRQRRCAESGPAGAPLHRGLDPPEAGGVDDHARRLAHRLGGVGAAVHLERDHAPWPVHLRGGACRVRVVGQARVPNARNVRHTYVVPAEDKKSWRVQQMLVDPEENNDWVAEFEVDLAQSRALGEPFIKLRRIGSLV